MTRVVDLSVGHPVLTCIALALDTGVHAGTLTTIPFPERGARVLRVAPDGTVTDAWTGLMAVTGVGRP